MLFFVSSQHTPQYHSSRSRYPSSSHSHELPTSHFSPPPFSTPPNFSYYSESTYALYLFSYSQLSPLFTPHAPATTFYSSHTSYSISYNLPPSYPKLQIYIINKSTKQPLLTNHTRPLLINPSPTHPVHSSIPNPNIILLNLHLTYQISPIHCTSVPFLPQIFSQSPATIHCTSAPFQPPIFSRSPAPIHSSPVQISKHLTLKSLPSHLPTLPDNSDQILSHTMKPDFTTPMPHTNQLPTANYLITAPSQPCRLPPSNFSLPPPPEFNNIPSHSTTLVTHYLINLMHTSCRPHHFGRYDTSFHLHSTLSPPIHLHSSCFAYIPHLTFLPQFTNHLLFLADLTFPPSRHMARLKTTARLVSPFQPQLTSSDKTKSQSNSTTSRSPRKRQVDTMDTVAPHLASTTQSLLHPTIPSTQDLAGPIAVRDWPEGCIPPPHYSYRICTTDNTPYQSQNPTPLAHL